MIISLLVVTDTPIFTVLKMFSFQNKIFRLFSSFLCGARISNRFLFFWSRSKLALEFRKKSLLCSLDSFVEAWSGKNPYSGQFTINKLWKISKPSEIADHLVGALKHVFDFLSISEKLRLKFTCKTWKFGIETFNWPQSLAIYSTKCVPNIRKIFHSFGLRLTLFG